MTTKIQVTAVGECPQVIRKGDGGIVHVHGLSYQNGSLAWLYCHRIEVERIVECGMLPDQVADWGEFNPPRYSAPPME